MSNFPQVVEDIRSEIQILPDGRGVASIRAVARLCGIQDSSLVRQFKGAALNESKLIATLGEHGFDSAALESFSQNGIPDIAIALILEYYAYDAGRYRSEQARKCCGAFRAIGVRSWMQQLTGWVQQPQNIDPILAQLKMLSEVRQEQLEQERRMQEQEQRLRQQDARLREFEEVRAEAHKQLIALPPSSQDIPPESMDMKIRRLVNDYCSATGIPQAEAFRNLYQQHYYRYRRRPQSLKGESKLQAFVRLGLVDSLYELAVDLLKVA
ncbi:MAG: hypothetical protein AAGA75_26660 [Cyanobacteria bacterium P01_E01_bin.6]